MRPELGFCALSLGPEPGPAALSLSKGELADLDRLSPRGRGSVGTGGAWSAWPWLGPHGRGSVRMAGARSAGGRGLRLGFFEVWRPDFKIRKSGSPERVGQAFGIADNDQDQVVRMDYRAVRLGGCFRSH